MGNISILSVLVGLFCLQFVYSWGPYGGGGGGGAPLIGGGGGEGAFGRQWCTCRWSCKKDEFCFDKKCRLRPMFPGWYKTCCRWLPYRVFDRQNAGVVGAGGFIGGGSFIGQKY